MHISACLSFRLLLRSAHCIVCLGSQVGANNRGRKGLWVYAICILTGGAAGGRRLCRHAPGPLGAAARWRRGRPGAQR